MSMPLLIAQVRDKLQQMSLREQLLVLAGLGAAIYLFFDVLVFNTQVLRAQAIQDRQAALQLQVTVLSADLAAIERSRADEFEKTDQEFRQLKQQMAQLDALTGTVIEQVPAVGQLVSDVLAASSAGARAVGVRTVPVKPITLASGPAQGKAPKANPEALYKHGVDIELRGNYLDLMRLLTKLEEANPKLLWSSAVLNAAAYPESTLRASVFLLSKQANL